MTVDACLQPLPRQDARPPSLLPLALGVACATMLAGCGGGGGNLRSDPPTVGPTTQPPPTPPPSPPATLAVMVNTDGSQTKFINGQSIRDATATSLTVNGAGGISLNGTNGFSQGLAVQDGTAALDPSATGSSVLDADVVVTGAGDNILPDPSGYYLRPPGSSTSDLFVGFATAADGSYVPAVVNGNVTLTGGAVLVHGIINGNISNNGYLFLFHVPGRDESQLVAVDGDIDNGTDGWMWLDSSVRGDIRNAGILEVHREDSHIVNAFSDDYPTGGHARIDGDYVQTATGILQMTFGSDLRVSGTATLAGTLGFYNDDTTETYLPANGVDTVLHADGGITGRFASLVFQPSVLLRGTLEYLANDVLFHATETAAGATMQAAGADALTLAGAANVDRAFRAADALAAQPRTSLTATQQQFLRSAGSIQHARTLTQATASFDSLSGQAYASTRSGLLDRFDNGPGLQALRDRRELPSAEATWFTTGDRDSTLQGLSQGSVSESATMGGIGRRIGTHALIGAAVGEGAAWMGFDRNGGQSRSRLMSAMLYGYGWHGPWYGYGALQGGRGWMALQHPIDLGDRRQHRADADVRVSQLRARVEGGADIIIGDGRLTPFAGVQHDAVHSGAFVESGDTGFELAGQAATSQRTSAELGLRYARDWRLDDGRLRLDIAGARRHALGLGGEALVAAFTGAPDVMFRIDGTQASREATWLDLQLSATRGDAWTGALRYRWDSNGLASDRGWWLGFGRTF